MWTKNLQKIIIDVNLCIYNDRINYNLKQSSLIEYDNRGFYIDFNNVKKS